MFSLAKKGESRDRVGDGENDGRDAAVLPSLAMMLIVEDQAVASAEVGEDCVDTHADTDSGGGGGGGGGGRGGGGCGDGGDGSAAVVMMVMAYKMLAVLTKKGLTIA